ncbi:hypothetical protein CSA56_08285 [candidate division KSB3 bacterium]|uniref:Rho termination factor N-terminal domain-containing protein n=1 Tax=candidate division KSB3 bacterium TaxID=2044937 RepID=A0A2G6KEP0_9BACT|nr:MAG: hypothetical protein CSA56_08285 [candidate division KSB3 bacterium]
MDAKTLSKMTVTKLRDEAAKFDDLKGVHGMDKPELLKVLFEKYDIHEEHHESQMLIDRKHALKAAIKKMKIDKEKAFSAGDKPKVALLQKELHRHRRLLRKTVKRIEAVNAL